MSPDPVWTSQSAVGATIAGANLSVWWHARTTRTERRERRDAEQRDQLLTALADLVAALADHRRAMWVLGDTRLRNADRAGTRAGNRIDEPGPQEPAAAGIAVAAAVATTHETRSAISAPLTRVRILAPGLAGLATKATHAAYALHDVSDRAVLDQRRQEALDAVAE